MQSQPNQQQNQPQQLIQFIKNKHPYEIVTLMIQMAQIVNDYHKNQNKTLGIFKMKDFVVQNEPNTNFHQVKFIGQPLFDGIYAITGMSDNKNQQVSDAPEVYNFCLDYQCDIYQLGVIFAFMITNRYVTEQDIHELNAKQDYAPQVTWVIGCMLNQIPSCRPGLEVVIKRLLQFEYRGQITINNGIFNVKKLPSRNSKQFYSLTSAEQSLKVDPNQEYFLVKDLKVEFIHCTSRNIQQLSNRDRLSNLINTIIRIKPKEKDIITFPQGKDQQLEEKQFKNFQFEAYYCRQQSKLIIFQFQEKLSHQDVDINLRLKLNFDEYQFIKLKFLNCCIHLIHIDDYINKNYDKEQFKNQAKLQFVWHKEIFDHQQKEWRNPNYFWIIKPTTTKTIEGLFHVVEPDTEGYLRNEDTANFKKFIQKFQKYLEYLKQEGLTIRRLDFQNSLESYFQQNLPLNCQHLRKLNEKSYNWIIKEFLRMSIDQIDKQIQDSQRRIRDIIINGDNQGNQQGNQLVTPQSNNQGNNQPGIREQLEQQLKEIEQLRSELLYKLNYN